MSLRPKFTTLDVKTTLENTVNRPAIPSKTFKYFNTVVLFYSYSLMFIHYYLLFKAKLRTRCYVNSIINCHRVSYRMKRYRFP